MSLVDKFRQEQVFFLEIDYFLNRIKNKDFFSYSRFNDGELICSIKNFTEITSTRNCDRHKYFPELGVGLVNSLNNSDNEKYFIQYLAGFINQEKFKDYTEILINKNNLNGNYVFNDFLQQSLRNYPEKFKDLVNTLNQNELMIVGPKYLENIKFLNVIDFVEVPTENCFLKKDEIIKEIDTLLKPGQIVLFSSSMATNVFIDILYKKYGNTNFLIDAGSVWDIFFYRSNPEIKQRTPNLELIERIKENYPNYFK